MERITLRGCAFLLFSIAMHPVFAAEGTTGSGIEEVIVTAQRTAESIQDVPIAVTAMTGEMLEEKQVITVSDLQMNAPNVSFTPTNFGSNSFSIRGIGRLVTASTGDAGVSIHVNEIAMPVNLTAVEFYDMERVEVLRGPQGTLFGRNATGGAVNFVTRMPDFESVGGFLDFEAGDYESYRLKGAINLPVTDNFALRFAAMKLDRDGYTKNLAYGQVGVDGSTLDGISKRVDGRDILTTRLTANWDITERDNLWAMWSYFDENDNRARITNQVCVQNDLPTYGCEPNSVGFEQPHLTSRFDMLVVGLYGVVPFGAPNATDVYNWPRPEIDSLREMHTDFEPIYKDRENVFLFGYTHEFDSMTLGVTGGYRRADGNYRQDYNMNVGVEFGPAVGVTSPNPFRADGDYPVSDTAGSGRLKAAGDDWLSGPCNAFDGTSGIWGGCIYRDNLSRDYTFDQASFWSEYYTVETKLQTSFEGPWNFLLGASYFDSEGQGDYYVNANGLDARADYYTGFFNNTGDPDGDTFGDGWAMFGEVYWDVTDRVKVTAGLRYNEDDKSVKDTSLLWNAQDANFPASLPLDDDTVAPLWTRVIDIVNGDPVSDDSRALANYYGATDAQIDAAALTAAQSAERLAINSLVPIVPGFNETRDLTGSPTSFTWKETTGRLGVDWQLTDSAMVYGFYSRGYKPGGANPAIPTQFQSDSQFDFEPEFIDSFEVGFKSTLADGTMVLNGAMFVYDYQGLQVARIKNNTSLNENIDSDVWGAEFEWQWQPDQLPGLMIDAHYSYLKTEVTGSQSVDPTNREGGDPDYITLNDFAFLYAAPRAQLTQGVVDAAIASGAAIPAAGAVYPDGTPGIPDGTPVVFSRAFLDAVGVDTVEGIPIDLDGNQLPNAPENTIHLGAAYTWNVAAIKGGLTLRWDYYWQDDSYAREFNTVGDQIDSWDQHNLSLFYTSDDGQWQAKLWVRNIEDEENVTGHYLTSDTSGYYRNYFLTEPQIWGASLRYSFGGG